METAHKIIRAMRWINLSKRQPEPGTKDLIIRGIKWRTIWHHREADIPLNDPKSWSEFEWLDEDGGMPIEESRCCEQNDKLRAQILKLSKLPHDLPLGAHFAEINKWIPDAIEVGYSPNDYPEDFWNGVSGEVKENFKGLLHIVPPVFHDILRFYMDVIEEVKGQKIVSQIEIDYMRYRDAKLSYQQFIDKWL